MNIFYYVVNVTSINEIYGINLIAPSDTSGVLFTFVKKILSDTVLSGNFNLSTVVPPSVVLSENTTILNFAKSCNILVKYLNAASYTDDPVER